MTAPISLAKARALIEADGRLTITAHTDGCLIAFARPDVWALTVYPTMGVVTNRYDRWIREIADRIRVECKRDDPAGLRRLGLAVHAWGAAAMVVRHPPTAPCAVCQAPVCTIEHCEDDGHNLGAEILAGVWVCGPKCWDDYADGWDAYAVVRP